MNDNDRNAAKLKALHLRATPNRLRLLQVMESIPRAVTVDELIRHLVDHGDTVSYGTVYRVLNDLESVGLVIRQWTDGVAGPKATFQGANSISPELAHRLACRNCGRTLYFSDVALTGRISRTIGFNAFGTTAQALQISFECGRCADGSPTVDGA